MTDADAGLMEAWDAFDYCCKLGAERGWCAIEAIHLDTVKKAYEAQRREIEELRREVVRLNGLREVDIKLNTALGKAAEQDLDGRLAAEAALSEAVKFIKFVCNNTDYINNGRNHLYISDKWLSSASVFAAKHGGRDG